MTKDQEPTAAELRAMAGEVLRLASKATPGPWHWNGDYIELEDYGSHWILDCPDLTPIGLITMTEGNYEEGSRNIDFAAKARELVPDLATALLAALDRVDELERYITEQIEKEPIPINSGVVVEGSEPSGTFACRSSYERGPK